MSAYGWVIVCSIVGPLTLSFDKKVNFIQHWKSLLIAILVVASFFIIWDQYFTVHQVWGFTRQYNWGIYFGALPLEEILFFVVIPYCCLFVHEVLKAYFPHYKGVLYGRVFAFTFVLSGLLLAVVYMKNWYTMTACSLSVLLVIGFAFQQKARWFNQFALTYTVALVPFLIVNGVLTGAITDEPIVWYSEDHIMGPRIVTIPVEDLYYNLCMLLPMVAIHEWIKSWLGSKQKA